MFTRLFRLAAVFLLFPPASPGHQGGGHPTNLDECEDILYALEWFHLFGTGVEANTSQHPLDPQDYFVSNSAADGEIPSAQVKIAWALGAQHETTYDDFYVMVSIGDSRKYFGEGNNIGTSYQINPIIDGWMGTMTVQIQHKRCAFSMQAQAHWAFEKPGEPQCESCATLTCDGRGEIKSVDIGIPLGPVRFGEKRIELGYESDGVTNEGHAKLAVLGPVGPNDASLTKVGDLITAVTTGNHLSRIQNIPSAEDPEKIRVDVSYDKTDPDNTIYRTSFLESFTTPTPSYRYTDTVNGRTTVRSFAQPSGDTWTLTEDDLQRTTKTKLSESLSSRKYRFTTEERDAANTWVVVSQRDETETKYTWG